MPSNYDDRLKDYVDVKDRIRLFYEAHPDGRLVTGEVTLTTEPDGVPRVMIQAFAYRSPDDGHPGVGHSWMALPGTTPYTRGSEVENTESSAWGRAIGALGIGIDKSIASADEVANKAGEDERKEPAKPKRIIDNGDGSLIGVVELAKDSPDFLPHIGPEGPVLTFKLVSPEGGIKVVATGGIAEVLATQKDDVLGKRVSCWGRVNDVTFRPKGAKRDVTYQVLELERIKTPTFTLPAPLDEPEPETPRYTGPMFEGMD